MPRRCRGPRRDSETGRGRSQVDGAQATRAHLEVPFVRRSPHRQCQTSECCPRAWTRKAAPARCRRPRQTGRNSTTRVLRGPQTAYTLPPVRLGRSPRTCRCRVCPQPRLPPGHCDRLGGQRRSWRGSQAPAEARCYSRAPEHRCRLRLQHGGLADIVRGALDSAAAPRAPPSARPLIQPCGRIRGQTCCLQRPGAWHAPQPPQTPGLHDVHQGACRLRPGCRQPQSPNWTHPWTRCLDGYPHRAWQPVRPRESGQWLHCFPACTRCLPAAQPQPLLHPAMCSSRLAWVHSCRYCPAANQSKGPGCADLLSIW